MNKYPTFLIFQSMSAIPRSLLMSRVFKPESICKLLLTPCHREDPELCMRHQPGFLHKMGMFSGCNPQKYPPAELEGILASRASFLIYPLNLNSFPRLHMHDVCPAVRLLCKVFPRRQGRKGISWASCLKGPGSDTLKQLKFLLHFQELALKVNIGIKVLLGGSVGE